MQQEKYAMELLEKQQFFTVKEMADEAKVAVTTMYALIKRLGFEPVNTVDTQESGRPTGVFSSEQKEIILAARITPFESLTNAQIRNVVVGAMASLHDDKEASQVALVQVLQNVHPDVRKAMLERLKPELADMRKELEYGTEAVRKRYDALLNARETHKIAQLEQEVWRVEQNNKTYRRRLEDVVDLCERNGLSRELNAILIAHGV
jgi:hypothetical protein